jgi:single-stranded DNA-binding protein
MNTKNTCKFEGRVIRKKVLPATEGKKQVVNVTIAVECTATKSNGEPYERTDFAHLVFWGEVSDQAASFDLQQEICVETRMQTRNYQSEEGKRYITDFVVLKILQPSAKPNSKPRKRA